MYNLDAVKYVWEEVVPNLSHYSDGLIFTPINRKYMVGKEVFLHLGTQDTLLKWKPFELNTADFKLIIQYKSILQRYI